jgi:hypothetical protein
MGTKCFIKKLNYVLSFVYCNFVLEKLNLTTKKEDDLLCSQTNLSLRAGANKLNPSFQASYGTVFAECRFFVSRAKAIETDLI